MWKLRFAAGEDAPAMLALYAPYVRESTASWEYDVPQPHEFEERLRQHRCAGFPWLTLWDDDTLLGYAYAGRYAQRRGYDWDCETTVYLAPKACGTGAAKVLYAALLSLLRAQGYVNAYALITHPNEASERFHEKMGFALLARLPKAGWKAGRWLGLSTYGLVLNPHAEPPAAPCAVEALSPVWVEQALRAALEAGHGR